MATSFFAYCRNVSQKKAYGRFQLQASSHSFQGRLITDLYLQDKNLSFIISLKQ